MVFNNKYTLNLFGRGGGLHTKITAFILFNSVIQSEYSTVQKCICYMGSCGNLCFLVTELQCKCLYEMADIPTFYYFKNILLNKVQNSRLKMCSDTCRCITNGKCCIQVSVMKIAKECNAVTTQAMVYPKQQMVSLSCNDTSTGGMCTCLQDNRCSSIK